MTARAIWKGTLLFGKIHVPVKLYSAAQDRAIHFRLLHEPDATPVRQRMVDPSNNEVPSDRIRRGLEVERGVYVLLDPSELASLEPEPSRDIEIDPFIPLGALGPEWYDRPYWLGPDGSNNDYFALARALAEQEREGIAHWVMRKHRYVGALRASNGYLALITLHNATEVANTKSIEAPAAKKAIDPKERKLATQLLSALEGEFDASALHDEHAARVRALVADKAEGKTIEVAHVPLKRATKSLVDALTKSVAEAKEKKVA